MIVEVCANSVASAINAQLGGANRVELCSNLSIGGTSPTIAAVELTREKLEIDLFVLIRPRAGDFCYNKLELKQMAQTIEHCKKCGVDGVVLGALTNQATIDIAACQQLITIAQPMEVTFHRAFDRVVDPFLALEQIIELGCHRILTSGQASKAADGKVLLKELVQKAGNRIEIMPGAGINSQNIVDLASYTKAKSFHLSAKKHKDSQMKIVANTNLSMGAYFESDVQEIKRVVELLKLK